MSDLMGAPAVVLANGQLDTIHGKTTHGLVRGPSRFRVVAVVEPRFAGRDAGELVDGRARGIPVVASVADALAGTPRPQVCVVGIATHGGILPDDARAQVLAAAHAGLTVINGLHRHLADDEEIAAAARAAGGRLIDFRRSKPAHQLRFWSGEILALRTPRIAVLGTDCAVGKRTTAGFLNQAFAERGIRSDLVYTGQTGYLQGYRHGFFFDATPNDFVAGELEAAVLDCARDSRPDIILVEGQASLRNPAGPCGAELLLSARADGTVLQAVPGRQLFEGLEHTGLRIPTVADEIALIESYGVPVLALTINPEGLDAEQAKQTCARLEADHHIPVVLPVTDGVSRVIDALVAHLGIEATP